jgi:hypothetical protein
MMGIPIIINAAAKAVDTDDCMSRIQKTPRDRITDALRRTCDQNLHAFIVLSK